MESYKHLYAKRVLAEWMSLRVHRVNLEHPVAFYDNVDRYVFCGMNWHDWRNIDMGEPTYDDLIAKGFDPICIFDVAVFDNSDSLLAALEVVHAHDITRGKRENFRYIQIETQRNDVVTPRMYRVDADWILGQTAPPARVAMERIA